MATRYAPTDWKAAAASAIEASAGTLCRCCGAPERARSRTICSACVDADCRMSTGCNRRDDDA